MSRVVLQIRHSGSCSASWPFRSRDAPESPRRASRELMIMHSAAGRARAVGSPGRRRAGFQIQHGDRCRSGSARLVFRRRKPAPHKWTSAAGPFVLGGGRQTTAGFRSRCASRSRATSRSLAPGICEPVCMESHTRPVIDRLREHRGTKHSYHDFRVCASVRSSTPPLCPCCENLNATHHWNRALVARHAVRR